MKLSPFQEKFCLFYVESNNATRSYQRAYENDNISTCKKNSHKLLKLEKIQNRIKELQKDIKKKHDITVDKLIQKNAELAFSDLNEQIEVDQEGNLSFKENVDVNQLDGMSFSRSESSKSSEKEESHSTSQSWSIKLSHKTKALQELARITGAYGDLGDNKEDRKDRIKKIFTTLQNFKKSKEAKKEVDEQ